MTTDSTPDPLHGVHEAEHEADVGESGKTPLILIGELWFVFTFAVLAVIAIVLVAVRTALL